MAFAYVDTSCLVAVAFAERGSTTLRRRLARFDNLFSSPLLEAELRAAFRREGVATEPAALEAVSWIVPDRPLSPEIKRVLDTGYVRGADCWHLATAIYLAEDPAKLTFLTLDDQQRTVAESLGFQV
ncbi:MAG: PIN domain-containing protein [Gemmatimonadales bacterium]